MSARLLGQGWQGKRENACVPFVDVGSALAICLVCAMGIHTTRRLSLCCVKMRDPVRAQYTRYVSLVVAGTSPGWSVSVVLLHRPLFGRAGQPWVQKDTTINVFCLLSLSLATLPGLVVCRVCVHHQGRRLVYARHALGIVPSQQKESNAASHPAPTTTQCGSMSSRQHPFVCRWMPGTGMQYCTMHSRHARAA
jgi:hypothetical protein